MNTKLFKAAGLVALVLVALGAGAWYLLAPPDTAPAQLEGRIEGTTLYPSDYVPAQTVCAQSVDDAAALRCTDAPEGDADTAPRFAIRVPPGTYEVYAFLKNPSDLGLEESPRAYWTEFVRCGLDISCPSHERIPVTVGSGETIIDVFPHDWYNR